MSFKTLTPAEKKRLERSLSIVSKLAGRDNLSETNVFILRQRMRHVLRLLGANHPNRVMVAQGIHIMKDVWPFKERRLRKLIDGRRRQ
jgi:hypothetical protein